MQVEADPNQLRYTASLFSNGAIELRHKAKQLEDIRCGLVQGQNNWKGEGAQGFSATMEKIQIEVQQKAGILEEAAQILIRFAYQMDNVNQMRIQAKSLEQMLWSITGDSEAALHERQSISFQINQLRQEADWQANAADVQATSAFHSLSIPMPDFHIGKQSPSFFDEIGHALKNAFDFVGGTVFAVADDLSMGSLDQVLDDQADLRSEAYQKGKVLGDEISVGIGVIAAVDGLVEAVGGAAGGVVFSETGVGALAGGAIAAEGLAQTAVGAGVTFESLQNLQKDTLRLAKIENGQETGLPNQVHHYATNKSKKYTDQFKQTLNKYNLKLDDEWNKVLMPHLGRHPNAYHEYVLEQIRKIDHFAKGNKELFLKAFEKIKDKIKSTPEMLRKEYWK